MASEFFAKLHHRSLIRLLARSVLGRRTFVYNSSGRVFDQEVEDLEQSGSMDNGSNGTTTQEVHHGKAAVDSSSFADGWDGQVSKGGAGEKVEGDLIRPNDAEIMESSHVWYACYGSNMFKPRFMCYIEGGQIEGMSLACHGCRDKSPPVASEWLSIHNRLFFGHKSTRTWGLGGVAFIDPVPEPDVLTHVRIYKIKMEQFNDVISQETLGRVETNWTISSHIDQLKKEPHHLMEIFEGSWYGTVMFLGEKDGLPILTFTCPESHMEKFRSGEIGTFAPPVTYRNVIVGGLVDDFGLTEQQAHDYVSSALLPNTDHKQPQ